MQNITNEENNLIFLVNTEWEYFHQQLRGDIAYLLSMKDLAIHLINSIRGIVQIDSQRLEEILQKQEKERADRLNAIVTTASSGLAVSSISTAVKAEIVCSVNENTEILNVYLCYVANVGTHALFGIVIAFIVWLSIDFFRSRK